MRERNRATTAFAHAVACIAMVSFAASARADGAMIYHDYFVEPPGQILMGGREIDLEFWMVGYTVNPFEEMCGHQGRARSGNSVADASPIFYIGSNRFDVPEGCEIFTSGLTALLEGEVEPSGNIYKIEAGYFGFVVYSRQQDKRLFEGATIDWFGRINDREVSKFLAGLHCSDRCPPDADMRGYFRVWEKFVDLNGKTDEGRVTILEESLQESLSDFVAFPLGYARYDFSLEGYYPVEVGNVGVSALFSAVIPIYFWFVDWALTNPNYVKYFVYLFGEAKPYLVECKNGDFPCLANIGSDTALQVMWRTPINH